MQTYFIHINGLVQGVGFRPHVFKCAQEMQLNGWVCNGNDGVHIEINASKEEAEKFYSKVVNSGPTNAIITSSSLAITATKIYSSFEIVHSNETGNPNLLLTPDFAICQSCEKEISDSTNNRYQYAFTTCLHCGPRYSITKCLPYDRAHTTMHKMHMCSSCEKEYHDIEDKRHYSQTNSCPNCAIQMHLFNSANTCIDHNNDSIVMTVLNVLAKGEIIAVKSMGGYLLICDATNAQTIEKLRIKKRRPAKPLAILYKNVERLKDDVIIRSIEEDALRSTIAPIVLCAIKKESSNPLPLQNIAPGLDKLGVMLPSSPLLYLLANQFDKPLIATSGNISGAPIIYSDVEALEHLFEVASLVLTYDRDIVAPQDDSVLQFTKNEQKIILRRSRGLAPNYFPNTIQGVEENILATGGELKSAFAISNHGQVFISQFLGDQSNVEAQDAYALTFRNFQKLFKTLPQKVLIDSHPNYFVSYAGKEIAKKLEVPVYEIQHHKAHFASVLSENKLLNSTHNIVGFIWDGTGYGEDGQIWGSELFEYHEKEFIRLAHLAYFPILVGDKMSKEPRLSALSLLSATGEIDLVKKYFSEQEWQYYSKLIEQPASIQTSSMGRFLDGITCLMGLGSKNSYEAEGVMKLEAIAREAYAHKAYYSFEIKGSQIQWRPFLAELILDIRLIKETGFIARKIMNSLVEIIVQLSNNLDTTHIAFSGGVFQNALLVDMIIERICHEKKIYFQKNVSPNDEGISLGQLAYYMNKPLWENEINPNSIRKEEENILVI